jgi:hypothetical protein
MRLTQARFIALLFASACLPVFAQSQEPASASQPISQAETLLFMTNHLKGAKVPAQFDYTFRRDGTMEAKFDDSVEMDLKAKGKDGSYATTRFLTGNRNVKYQPVENPEGNPILLWFLDRDINEMERLTGGKAPYFRKRIRLALADKAEMRPVKFEFAGKEVSGSEIRIAPYLDDPNKAKFGKVSTSKYYVFTLSDQVPGGVYQIRAVVPDEGVADGKPLIDETLTFSRVARLKD